MTGRSLWRHRDFLKLWTGETVSLFGTQVSLLAMPLVALTLLHATTFQVGLLTTVERLPFLLVGLHAGAIVDRLRRRPVLITADLGRVVALASIPVAYWAGHLTMAQIYGVVFAVGILTVFFDVAYQSYLPALVDRDALVEGNAKLEVSRSSSDVAGPAAAGVLYQVMKAGAITIDAASYAVSALCIALIRRPEPDPRRDGDAATRRRLRTDIAEGLRYVLGHPHLRWIASYTGSSNFFSSLQLAVLFTYAVRVLHLSAGTIGLVFSVGGLSVIASALAAGPVARRLGVGPTIVWAAFWFGPPGLLIPLAPKANPLPWLIAALAIGSLAGPIYNITQVSLRQAITPARLQGRMNATMRFLVWGTMPLGAFAGGVIGSRVGLHPALWVAAIGQLVSCVPLALSSVRKLREVPAPSGSL